MKNNFTVSIPHPCTQKWDEFTTSSHGRLCGSCNKVVVDFTHMGDEEILLYFQNQTGKTCGRLRSDQLKTYINYPPLKAHPHLTFLKAGALSLLFLLVGKNAYSQDSSSKPKTEVVNWLGQKVNESTLKGGDQILRGVVTGEDKEALAGATIRLLGTDWFVVADSAGRFVFPLVVNKGDILEVDFIGVMPKVFTVPKKTTGILEISLKCEYEWMGEVAINSVYEPRTSGLRKMWRSVRKAF